MKCIVLSGYHDHPIMDLWDGHSSYCQNNNLSKGVLEQYTNL